MLHFAGKLYRVVLCRCKKIAIPDTTNETGPQDADRQVAVGSNSDSDGEVTAVASVTYRFQVKHKVFMKH